MLTQDACQICSLYVRKQSNHVVCIVAWSSGTTLARYAVEHGATNAGLAANFSLGCAHCRGDYTKHILVKKTRQLCAGGTPLVHRLKVGAKAHWKLEPCWGLLQHADHFLHEHHLRCSIRSQSGSATRMNATSVQAFGNSTKTAL